MDKMTTKASAVATARGDSLATQQCDLLAPENEYLDPNPDLHSLFLEYNRMFFEGRLAGCEVKWSKRMTLCEPLLKLRPRSDMVNTLLHEMIHAYVFVATPVRDHEDHGPLFQAHMNRINEAAKTKITVFHTFHDEVDSYRQHVWQCSGLCRRTAPYFGLVKRAMNRAPGPTDRWWADHERGCGGRYTKIKEPAEFTAKQAKKKERELARAEKQKKKDKDMKSAPSVKLFFPTVNDDDTNIKVDRGDTKPRPRAGNKAIPQLRTESDSNKKQKREHTDDKGAGWPVLGFPCSAPAIFSADGDEDGYFLVGDIQALFQISPSQQLIPRDGQLKRTEDHRCDQDNIAASNGANPAAPAIVDLTVSDSEDSANEQLQYSTRVSPVRLIQATAGEDGHSTTTREPNVIELD
ncbi:Hypothetical protein PHPALM_10066 [Phytophthora palmivora]|uniref:SprT-like domain-containing protein n=1 Tax=Phytophthora palmivora TaxID=4796 RepID=A0A2P4Y5K6_9STRA|nr:Hypothetical protein PHPALM_10066 [Phytophthora palmivora]